METLTARYPQTRQGREDFIHDAFKDIPDDGFKVTYRIKEKPDKALRCVSFVIEGVITLIISPVVIVTAIWAGIVWLLRHSVRYPLSKEAKQLRATEQYLNQCKHYQHEKN
jgi:hypothetical protein